MKATIPFFSMFFLLLPACSPVAKPKPALTSPPVQAEPTKSDRWMALTNAEDLYRLRGLKDAWTQGLRDACPRFASALREEGALLVPDAALPRPAPTPGSYNCRMVRLGRTKGRAPAFERFKPFFCYVEVDGDLLTVVKQTGSERPAGRLWEDNDPSRLIFLGSMAMGEEQQPKAYGEDKERDMAGVMERIGPMRWRLAVPWPRANSKLDLIELTPVADQPPA